MRSSKHSCSDGYRPGVRLVSGICRTVAATLVTVGALAAATASAQVVAPERILCILVDPVTPTTLYIGTEHGVFRSLDNGGEWTPINTGLNGAGTTTATSNPYNVMGVTALAAHPAAPETLYAGTSNGAFKSTDSGRTWRGINNGLYPGLGVVKLVIDPIAPTTLYASTIASEAGVFRSTDGGESWQIYIKGLGTGANARRVTDLSVSAVAPTTLYVSLEQGGIFKRTGDADWQLVKRSNYDFYCCTEVEVHPLVPTTVYATGGTELYKSTDAGVTWDQIKASPGMSLAAGGPLVLNPATPDILYASVRASVTGPARSTDGGRTWTPIGTAVRAIDPVHPTTLYALDTGGFVSRSLDEGETWNRTDVNHPPTSTTVLGIAVDPLMPATVYAGGSSLFKSVDGGRSWGGIGTGTTSILSGAVVPLAIDPVTSGTAYAARGMSVLVTHDGGQSWSEHPTNFYPTAAAIDPSTPSTVYVGGPDGLYYLSGLVKSLDGGATWIDLRDRLTHKVTSLAIDPATPTTVYAGTSDGGVYKSLNGGDTWQQVLSSFGVDRLVIDPLTPTTLYAAYVFGNGIVKSTDGGNSWSPVSNGLPARRSVLALAIDPVTPTTVYAAVTDGVFVTDNGGDAWRRLDDPACVFGPSTAPAVCPFDDGLGHLTVAALAIDPLTPTTIYAATAGGGTFVVHDASSGSRQQRPASGTPLTVPGHIAAERYDLGGQGLGYTDTTRGNEQGFAVYRTDDVDIKTSQEGGYAIGWMAAGESLSYTVNVTHDRFYRIQAHVGSALPDRTFHVEVDHVDTTGPIAVPQLADWDQYQTVTSEPVRLTAGVHVLRLVMGTDDFMDFRWLDIVETPPPGVTPQLVPGTIEAEDYDLGGEGVGYVDTTPGNDGGAYRSDDVDIKPSESGGYAVGWLAAGEWLAYSVDVEQDGLYTFTARVGSPFPDRTFHIEADGIDVTGPIAVPEQADWDRYDTVVAPEVALHHGVQQLRVVMGPLDFMDFQSFAVAR